MTDVNVELKRGYLPMSALTTIFISDEETWADFIHVNTVSEKEHDINGKPFKTLNEKELNALADYCWTNCQKVDSIWDYHFEVGQHKVAFGSRTWYNFMECVNEKKSK